MFELIYSKNLPSIKVYSNISNRMKSFNYINNTLPFPLVSRESNKPKTCMGTKIRPTCRTFATETCESKGCVSVFYKKKQPNNKLLFINNKLLIINNKLLFINIS